MAILEFRRRIGCTQQQLGESTGVSASMVAQWESGKKDPSYDSLKRMFQLGATVDFASNLLRANVSIKAVQALMRHESPQITLETYGHLVQSDLHGALEKL